MLRWAIVFFTIALITGIAGFSGATGLSDEMTRTLVIIFFSLFLMTAVTHTLRDFSRPM